MRAKMYSPEPKFRPKVLPREIPKIVIPSYIGESGQVGNWLFYNGAGGDLYDFSDYDNHGDLTGPTWVDGKYGWCLDFEPPDEGVTVPDTPSLDITDEITMVAWWYQESRTDSYCSVMRKSVEPKAAPYSMYTFGLNDVNNLHAELAIGGSQQIYEPGIEPAVGEWLLYGLTYDGSNVYMYLDDSQVGSWSQTGTIDTNEDPLYLGCSSLAWATSETIDGRIAIAMLFDRAWTEDEYLDYYHDTKSIFK